MTEWNEELMAARDALAKRIREMSEHPKPNYEVDGESYAWGDLFRTLMDEIAKLDRLLACQTAVEEVGRGVSP